MALVEYSAVAVQRFVGADPEQADRFSAAVRHPVPSSELLGEVFLVHPVAVGSDGVLFEVDDVRAFGHGTDPCVLLLVVPRVPEHLVAAEGGSRGHGQAHPVGFRFSFDSVEGALDVLGRGRVLRFEILMEHADDLVGEVLVSEVEHQVEQKAAVLASRERHEHVVELFEHEPKTVLQRFENVLFGVSSDHIVDAVGCRLAACAAHSRKLP